VLKFLVTSVYNKEMEKQWIFFQKDEKRRRAWQDI